MLKKALVLFIAAFFSAAIGADWQSFRVRAKDAASIQRLADSEVVLLSERVGHVTDVAVANESGVRKLGLPYRRLGSVTDPAGPYRRTTDGSDYTTEYFTLDEIIAKFEEWRAQYPSLIQREQIATSHDGRPVWAYRLHNSTSALPPGAVFYHGLIHAREWISGPVAMYNFESLLKDALSSANGWQRITRLEFNVVPVLNPDGYSYSWTTFRLWRKNRRNNGGGSFGVDLNRNYTIGWGGVGSSGNTNSDTYRGPSAFSEPELSGLRAYLGAKATQMSILYTLDYDSYGQYVIHPLGYTKSPAPDHAALNAMAHIYSDALTAQCGLQYTVGQSSVEQYPAGGTSEDFYYDEYGALGGTIELRPTGGWGFELPPNQILPTIREHWAGFRAAVDSLYQ